MENVSFLSVSEFKTQTGINTMEVLRNPNTNKLFLAGDNGVNYKCEQLIDSSKTMKMLVPENGALTDACLVNVKPGAIVEFSL